uniref:uncharacterized protein LOC100182860 isoform X5 n=1 Tax=Ciona intestinalis TaxID=7719 RepID=UPI000EF47B39|nr:uncharacterized protein LOC100182860 isoform X5 [Ciona intestinalis]|eukprot:XP_026690371.1 uncharacterized protein LOC100182860 isoform X5 [Ciona intestinalis]
MANIIKLLSALSWLVLCLGERDVSQILPFRDLTLSREERVEDLVSRLTVKELVLQISRGGAGDNGPAPAITRLGIGPYQWNTECLRGYAMNGDATCFPQPIGLAATFDQGLIYKLAKTIALEARAKHNNFTKNGNFGDHTGLSCFSPVINILRHPLWGRNQETFGEDPVMSSLMARAYVTGLQGDEIYYPATANCKHFAAYDGPENIPSSRLSFNANVSIEDLGRTYFPAFRECVHSGAFGIVCSYNAINGEPACASSYLQTILRDKFNFKGYVSSDESAIEFFDIYFKYTKSNLLSAVAAFDAGVDLELTSYGKNNRYSLLNQAVEQGLVTEAALRRSAKRLFRTRMALGEFDPQEFNHWLNVPIDVVQSLAHRKQAVEVAAKSFVLLKNDGVLPLNHRYENVAIVGPFINNSEALTGDYHPNYNLKYFSSPLFAANSLSSSGVARFTTGCVGTNNQNLPICATYNSTNVKEVVTGSDIVLVTLGTGRGVEAESNDRRDINLPGKQLQLIQDVVKYANGPVIVVLFNAGPLDVSWVMGNTAAVIACHFSAQMTGEAMLEVLTGVVNPAGRLPNTWPASMEQVPPMTDYSMHERTYRYSTSSPLFPFGYGLSYTKFWYLDAVVEPTTIQRCQIPVVRVLIQNTGHLDGEEVVQIYMTSKKKRDRELLRQLVAFQRVPIKAGEEVSISLPIPHLSRAIWMKHNRSFDYYFDADEFTLYVGGQQPHQVVKVPSNILELSFKYELEFPGQVISLSDCNV